MLAYGSTSTNGVSRKIVAYMWLCMHTSAVRNCIHHNYSVSMAATDLVCLCMFAINSGWQVGYYPIIPLQCSYINLGLGGTIETRRKSVTKLHVLKEHSETHFTHSFGWHKSSHEQKRNLNDSLSLASEWKCVIRYCLCMLR